MDDGTVPAEVSDVEDDYAGEGDDKIIPPRIWPLVRNKDVSWCHENPFADDCQSPYSSTPLCQLLILLSSQSESNWTFTALELQSLYACSSEGSYQHRLLFVLISSLAS